MEAENKFRIWSKANNKLDKNYSNIQKNMKYKKINVLYHLCKGGSKTIKNKALKKINRKHLIEITIKQALL